MHHNSSKFSIYYPSEPFSFHHFNVRHPVHIFPCSNKLFYLVIFFCKLSVFNTEFQKFFAMTRTFFFHSRSEHFWKQNTLAQRIFCQKLDYDKNLLFVMDFTANSECVQRKEFQTNKVSSIPSFLGRDSY